jgi:hypothetical protein
MAKLSAIKCSYITILRVSLVSFAALTIRFASQRVFIVVVYFVIDSVRKLLDTTSYVFFVQEINFYKIALRYQITSSSFPIPFAL